ncbi:MAG: phospholipid carrier-dependent glycosyltransferase [Ardenticatenales bacterium]
MTRAAPRSRDERSAADRRRAALGLTAIVAVALALRWWGASFGLPATYHPDEHQYVDAAVAAVGGALNPGRFNNPSLLKYALAAVYACWYAIGRLAGAWPTVGAWQAAVTADPTIAYVIARALVGALGASTCIVVAMIGRRLRDGTTGLVAAALLAIAFLHVRDGHYAVNDVPAALLTTLAVAIALRVRATGRGRDLVVGAAVVGLAAATKYTALVAVLPVGLGWLAAADGRPGPGDGGADGGERSGGDEHRRGLVLADAIRGLRRQIVSPAVAVAALVLVVAFVCAVPYAVLDWPAFHADVALLATRGREGFKGLQIDPAPGWIFYLKSLGWGLGWPLLAAAIAGLALALRRRRADDVIVAVVPLVLWGYLGSQLNMFARFMLPAVPLLCVFAADAVVVAGGSLARRFSRRAGGDASRSRKAGPYVAALALAVGLPSLIAAVRHDVLLGRTDTRELARRWIADHVPAGATILLQSGGPELDGLDMAVESVGTLELPERPLDDWQKEFGATDPVWLVTSSFSTERRQLDRARDAAARAWYADLARRWRPSATFTPLRAGGNSDAAPQFVFDQVYGPCTDLWRFDRPGPTVNVFRLSR